MRRLPVSEKKQETRNKKLYGKLPPKKAETNPWDVLCVDLIGKYQFSPKGGGKEYTLNTKKGHSVYLQAVTMIDPATGWVEIRTVPSARADLVANQVELAWLTRYPLPSKVIVDRGKEFFVELKTMMSNDYSIKVRPITTRNPQANAILERVHQTIGNIICAFEIQGMVLDDNNPWDGILAATMFALRATVHTTTQYTPAQLVFDHDSILNTRHEADWQLIKTRKQSLINKGNAHENNKRLTHAYKPGDQVLLKNAWKTKYNNQAYIGPYTITAVNKNNGTVNTRKGKVTDTYNIRNITPYRA